MIEKIYQIFHLVASYVYPLEEKLPNFKCVERVFSGASWKATGKLAAHRYHKGNNWGRNLKDDESMTKACCKGRPMKTCRQIHREGKARKRWYGSISESVFCPKGRDSKMCTQ